MSNECMSLPPIPKGILVEDDPVENVMELVCENCHYPYVEPTEDNLESKCDKCTIEREIRILLGQVKREDDFAEWDKQFEDSGE